MLGERASLGHKHRGKGLSTRQITSQYFWKTVVFDRRRKIVGWIAIDSSLERPVYYYTAVIRLGVVVICRLFVMYVGLHVVL